MRTTRGAPSVRFICFSSSSPSILGIRISAKTSEAGDRLNWSSASSPSQAMTLSNPFRRIVSDKAVRIKGSSSTTRIRGFISDSLLGGRRLPTPAPEQDGERGPLPDAAFQVHPSPVSFEDPFDNGQAEPRTLRLRREEREKDLLQISFGDTAPAVRHRNLHTLTSAHAARLRTPSGWPTVRRFQTSIRRAQPARRTAGTDPESASRRHGLDGVEDKVQENLFHQLPVGLNLKPARVIQSDQINLLLLERIPRCAERLLDHLVQIERSEAGSDRPRKSQQVGQHGIHGGDARLDALRQAALVGIRFCFLGEDRRQQLD